MEGTLCLIAHNDYKVKLNLSHAFHKTTKAKQKLSGQLRGWLNAKTLVALSFIVEGMVSIDLGGTPKVFQLCEYLFWIHRESE
jgi:hypothetical protein